MRYPWQLLHRLANRIELAQSEDAHSDLDQILRVISGGKGRLDIRKMRSSQVISFCLRGAYKGGAPSDLILEEHHQVLQNTASERTWAGVQRLMHDYVDNLLAKVRPERRTDLQRFLVWMRRDMAEHTERPRRLSEYARIAGLSVEHLSRTFSSTVGRTYREEVKLIRMQTAKQLLTKSSLKVSTVAHRVGLKDTSQFIRDFRQVTGLTPGEYREHQSKAPAPS